MNPKTNLLAPRRKDAKKSNKSTKDPLVIY